MGLKVSATGLAGPPFLASATGCRRALNDDADCNRMNLLVTIRKALATGWALAIGVSRDPLGFGWTLAWGQGGPDPCFMYATEIANGWMPPACGDGFGPPDPRSGSPS
jgi:hypothetical protein